MGCRETTAATRNYAPYKYKYHTEGSTSEGGQSSTNPPSPSKNKRETVSQRMKRAISERKLAAVQQQPQDQERSSDVDEHSSSQDAKSSKDGQSSPVPATTMFKVAWVVVDEMLTLEEMCVRQIAETAKSNRLPLGLLTDRLCPDYLRCSLPSLLPAATPCKGSGRAVFSRIPSLANASPFR